MKAHLIDARTQTVIETREVPVTGNTRNDRRAVCEIIRSIMEPHISGGYNDLQFVGANVAGLSSDLFLRFGTGDLVGENIPSTVGGQTSGYKDTEWGTHFAFIER